MTRSDRSDATAAAFPASDESTPVVPAARPGRAPARRASRDGAASASASMQLPSVATDSAGPLPKTKTKPAAAAAPAVRRSGRPDWRALPPPHPMLRAVVVVPVKDEAVLLPRCLAALSRQCTAAGRPVDPRSFEVIMLANNCSDASAAIARRFAAAQRRAGGCTVHVVEVTLPRRHAHVGHARGVLMDQACARLRRVQPRPPGGRGPADSRPRGVILSTDGDTVVAADWLAETLAAVDAGADAVGGRILSRTEPAGAAPVDRALQRWQRLDAIYRLLRSHLASLIDPEPADPWPRHHQHYGASLAVTVDAYEQVGGLPEVRFLEDEALYGRLVRADLRVRHSPQVRVYTSCRQDGRVEVGLSSQLREWACAATGCAELRVEPAGEMVALLRGRARLRRLWLDHAPCRAAPRGAATLARELRLPAERLRAAWSAAATFGELWGEVEAWRASHRRRGAVSQVPVGTAIVELKQLVECWPALDELPPAGLRPAGVGPAYRPADAELLRRAALLAPQALAADACR